MKKRFLCDVDGIVADFTAVYLSIVRQYNIRSCASIEDITVWDIGDSLRLTKDERDEVHYHLYCPGVASSIPVIEKAVEHIIGLAEIADLWFVTSPLDGNPTWEFERRYWLEKHFGSWAKKRVISTPEKSFVGGDFFLDDKTTNALAWALNNPCGITFLWETPWARKLDTALTKIPTGTNSHVEVPCTLGPSMFVTKSWEVIHDIVSWSCLKGR